MKLGLLPAGSIVFADANVLAYHFTKVAPMADVCTTFLHRAAGGEIKVITSSLVVAEVIHRLSFTKRPGHSLFPGKN